MTHPTLDIKGSRGSELSGKKIVLGVTGSIAAVETIKLARELIRYSADVYGVMTKDAQKIIHPYALQYATGRDVITEITGDVEHIELCGNREGKADLLLIAPCTANTIGKIATGVDDTPVTTFASTAIGAEIPIIIVPAMHESMYSQPIAAENIQRLKKVGIEFVGPRLEEGGAKIADTEDVILRVLRSLSKKELKGKKVLVTGGATAEAIDPIRILTNRSSGKTGLELAREAFIRGAGVTLVQKGKCPYADIQNIYIESAKEMSDAVLGELKKGYDVFICAAAVSDYTIDKSKDKIPSGQELTLNLKPVPKVIERVRAEHPRLYMVSFKAETNVPKEELIDRARSMKDTIKLNLAVANDVGKGGIGGEENEVYIIGDEITHVKGSKREIAKKVIDAIVGML